MESSKNRTCFVDIQNLLKNKIKKEIFYVKKKQKKL